MRDITTEDPSNRAMTRKALLTCGLLGPTLFVGMVFFVGVRWDGYSVVSQTPSELSAIGAPTRSLWILLGTVYAALMAGFGWVVWKSSMAHRGLRIVGGLLMAQALFGCFWPPMHQRAVLAAGGSTLTDSLHLVWAMATSVVFMVSIGIGAAAFGRRFRGYSIATLVVVLVSGIWTATYAPRIHADLPTPGVGIVERVSILGFMLWVAVLAIVLLRQRDSDTPVALADETRRRQEMP